MSFPLPPPMRRALDLAAEAAAAGEVPVGAVVTRGDEIVAEARNAMRGSLDPTAHAEMVAIRAAAERLGSSRLDECTLWVTLEPCAMCAAAIALARIAALRFAAEDPKGGGVVHGAAHFRPADLPSPARRARRDRRGRSGDAAARILRRAPVVESLLAQRHELDLDAAVQRPAGLGPIVSDRLAGTIAPRRDAGRGHAPGAQQGRRPLARASPTAPGWTAAVPVESVWPSTSTSALVDTSSASARSRRSVDNGLRLISELADIERAARAGSRTQQPSPERMTSTPVPAVWRRSSSSCWLHIIPWRPSGASGLIPAARAFFTAPRRPPITSPSR